MTLTCMENPVYEGVEEQLPQLRRYACALTRNMAAADDLVQECVARALTKSNLYRPGTNLRAWLFTILHNIYISDMRQHARIGYTVDANEVRLGLSIAPDQEHHLELSVVGDKLRTLPAAQRRALELIGIEGLSYEDAAAVLNLPVGTLKSRVSRGRARLREALTGTVHPRRRSSDLRAYGALPSFSGGRRISSDSAPRSPSHSAVT